MTRIKDGIFVAGALIGLVLALPSNSVAQTGEMAVSDAPAGTYKLDKAHASLIFRVDHLGFSNYTARFKQFDATLQFDPADPTKMSVSATIDPASIETDFPNPEKLDFNGQLKGAQWLDVVKFPQITYRSNAVKLTGANRANVDGELQLHGIKKPVTLQVTFNGGYRGFAAMDPNARIGFSARGSLKRSEFGVALGIPPAGTKMGVSDEVEVVIEAEFNGPPLKDAKASQ